MADAVFVDKACGPADPVGRVLNRLARALAVAAGLVLVLMALMSLASIVGRTLLDKPILGDYELVQSMSAVAVALTLPFCQMIRGHIIVDFFSTGFPKRLNRGLDALANLVLGLAGFLVAWRTAVGMVGLYASGDASMLLNLPIWWAYVPMVPAFFLLGCTGLYAAWVDWKSLHTGRTTS
ncbi:MAG: TRAP transporter small permease [Rhodoferax sp.]